MSTSDPAAREPVPVFGWQLAAGDLLRLDIPEGTVSARLGELEVLPSVQGDARSAPWTSTDGKYCGRLDFWATDEFARICTRDERTEASRNAATAARWAA